jgi:fructose-1-phosphate kinase PfkB-like protein
MHPEAGVILTVTLNPAWDLTYQVSALNPAAALQAGPELVKPNRAELRRAVGSDHLDAGAAAALTAGAGRVVVTDGPDGMYGFDEDYAWHARPPVLSVVDPTGAGDAALANLAVGLLQQDPWRTLLRRAVAWSAAAALHPRAGHLQFDSLADLDGATLIRRIDHPCPTEIRAGSPRRNRSTTSGKADQWQR